MEGELFQKNGFIAGIHNLAEVWVTHINIQLWKETLSADFYTCDIKRVSQLFQGFKSSDMLEVSKILATQKGL